MTDCNQFDCNNKLISLIRNKYFYGKLLTVDDFNKEQNYFIEKDRIINRLIHGTGIIYGLHVTLSNDGDKTVIHIQPGAALDGYGNLIIVNSIASKEIGKRVDGKYFVYLKFATCLTNPQPAIQNNNACQEECCYGSVKEVFEIIIEDRPEPEDQKTDLSINEQLEKNCFEFIRSNPEGITAGDSKVLIAAIKVTEGKCELDEGSLLDYRSVVYNHPMLRDLLLTHIKDFENPHNTNASQVKALQRINDIGNLNNEQGHVPNINFVSDSDDGEIDISPDEVQNNITIKLADNAVQRKHLNSDVISKLLASKNQTVSITGDSSNPKDKKINIQTIPAGEGDIKSIGSINKTGASSKFAPADHVHGLRINDIAPDEDGQIFLTPGENITITKLNSNKLVISTPTVPTSVTGTVTLVTDSKGNAMSELIDPGIKFPYSLTIGLQQETVDKQVYVDFGTPVFPYGDGMITASSRFFLSGKDKGNFVISANYFISVPTRIPDLSNKKLIFHWVATPAVNINPVTIENRQIFEPPFKTAVPILDALSASTKKKDRATGVVYFNINSALEPGDGRSSNPIFTELKKGPLFVYVGLETLNANIKNNDIFINPDDFSMGAVVNKVDGSFRIWFHAKSHIDHIYSITLRWWAFSFDVTTEKNFMFSIAPKNPRIKPKESINFAAYLNGALTGDVKWEIVKEEGVDGDQGFIDKNGLFKAPDKLCLVKIKATYDNEDRLTDVVDVVILPENYNYSTSIKHGFGGIGLNHILDWWV